MIEFYDRLAPLYHLIFQDGDASIARQAQQLREIVTSEWGSEITKVLDVSCGIGTQAIALAQAGFSKAVQTHAMRSRYYAISPCKVLTLMEEAGFAAVKRLDDVFYQPVLIGTKLP